MKKGVLALALFVGFLCFNLVSAETTFFEGELGDGFVMASGDEGEVSSYCGNGVCDAEESCSSCSQDCGKCLSGGGRMVLLDEELICDIVFDDLRRLVGEEGRIEFSSREFGVLVDKINNQSEVELSADKILSYVDDFEEKCDSYLPLWSGLALGRYRNLIRTLLGIITILVVGFLIYLIIIFFRARSRIKRKEK